MRQPRAKPRRQPLNSVSTKIIFFVFLSTFVTALVVSWISIQSTHRYLRRQIDRSFPALLERSRTDLDRSLEALQIELDQLAESEELRRTSASSFLRERAEASDAISDLALIGPSGRILAAGDQEGSFLLAADAEPGRMATFVDASGSIAMMLFAAIPGSGQEGETFLAARVSPEALAELLEFESLHVPGRLFLTDGEGRSLSRAPREGDSAPEELQEPPLAAIARFAERDPNVVHEYTNSDGEHVLGALAPLQQADLFLAVEAPFEESFAPVLSVVTRIFVSDLCIILLFSCLAYKVTAKMMQPIEALSEGARRISQGQTDHEIPDPGINDELGLLTRTFNEMMRKLRHNHLEIEQAAQRLRLQNEELHRANEVLSQLSITDGLTKLHNHRYFQDHLTREIKRLARSGGTLAMLLVDLDDFKQLNDRYGHAAGDEILVRMASIMSASVRDSDFLARYGGEEFVVLATNTDLAGGIRLAEKIRMSVDESVHIIDESLRPLRGVTVSIGVAEYHGDRKQFFRAADRALYRAKAQGKNCVVTSEELPLLPDQCG